jgi:hypothetical protein
MRYRIVGFVVVKAAKWYLRRRYGVLVSRPVLLAGAVGVAVAVAAAAGARRSGGGA